MNYSIHALIALFSVLLFLTSGLTIPDNSDDATVHTKHVLENDTLLLVCNSTELADVEDFQWIKNDTAGKSSDFYARGWKVEFFSITRKASGIYICHALDNRTGENITLTAIKVDVQYPTECRSMSLGPQVITENETFSVSCSMHGNPEPHWGIYNNDTGVAIMEATLSADATLTKVPVRCGYQGFWVCTGENRLNNGVNATRGYYLDVLCAPRPDPYSKIDLNYRASVHEYVSMALKVNGDPVPTYTWLRDDNKPLGDVVINEGPRGTTLTFLDVDVNDFGNYTLRMNNSMGSYDAHFTLHAYGYPGKPYNFRATTVSYDSVDLSWTSGYDMGTKQHFMITRFTKMIYETISGEISGPYNDGGVGQNWTYHLTGLHSDTEYRIAVLAENAQNFTFSDKIVFNTTSLPTPHAAKKTSVAVIAGGVVGGVFLLMLVIGIASFVYRKRNTVPLKDKGPLMPHTNNRYGGTYAVNNTHAL